ncbi:GDP-mannose 4,6-dehydratase [Puniceicoccaceae bacterium K14]|nr:GDP-mannose 4,6-dehydratase [Puniceicoccaceae bacterium K14]
MKILVTGSAGFIGSHVAHELLDQGHEVVGYDNFNDYYDVSLKGERHKSLIKRERFNGVRGDLFNYELLSYLFEQHKFELVCHLAAQAGVRYSIENPFAYEQANLNGHLNILECCRKSEVKRLVYASSSSVYGGNKKVPFAESDAVDHPVSLYAATKKANELMTHCYTHLYGFQSVGLRFFTVYGPWGRPDMAYWLFAEAMLKGEEIKVFNNGDMQRDFTYIDDIVSGVVASLFVEGLEQCELFNLGNNRPEQLMDMISVLSQSLEVEPKMKMMPMQPGDVHITYADISKAQSKLGYKPEIRLEDGLSKFANWYKEYLRNTV